MKFCSPTNLETISIAGEKLAFFSRRRIQFMLDEMNSYLDAAKRKDLVQRLNSKEPEQSLGAEVELSIAWSLRDFDLEIEPIWWKPPKKPDLYVEGLVPDFPVAIEVTSFADVAISGEEVMDSCAQELIKIANSARKGTGDHLYFNYAETYEVRQGKRERGIAAPKGYKPSIETMRKLTDWLSAMPKPEGRLRIVDEGLIVEIEFREYKHSRYHNFHVSRPPRVYSDTNNPLYRRLDEKADQLRDSPKDVLRVVVVFEAGSRFLSEITKKDYFVEVERYSRAKVIIEKFTQNKSKKVDSVVVIVPDKRVGINYGMRSEPSSSWHVSVFGSSSVVVGAIKEAFSRILTEIPAPRLDGYNARSLVRQKAMNYDSRGWYLPTRFSMTNDRCSYRMSTRAFQDFLSERISEEQFRRFVSAGNEGPSLGRFLSLGFTIQGIQFESGGIDKDDDYIVLELVRDAAAKPFE